MLVMIVKMSIVTGLNVVLTCLLWRLLKDKKLNMGMRISLGIFYGFCAIISTHYGVDYQHMMLNVRDLSPLAAGLFFDPVSGIIAGLIGGIERYIAGTYFGVASYTTIACSVSTCLSGIFAALMHCYIFKGKKPSLTYSYFLGSTMEVFHMYVVFATHRGDMDMAFYVVNICAGPMIMFTGIGLALISVIIKLLSGEKIRSIRKMAPEEVEVSQEFQFWLFLVTAIIMVFNLLFGYVLQTQTSVQNSKETLVSSLDIISKNYDSLADSGVDYSGLTFYIGENGGFEVYDSSGMVLNGNHSGETLSQRIISKVTSVGEYESFTSELFDTKSLCVSKHLSDDNTLLVWLPTEEVYKDRNQKMYENIMADILLFTVIYILISMLVQSIVVGNLHLVNESLNRITEGNLDEEVSVYSSSEFASLSDDINHTVTALKRYIEMAEHRIEQELEYARSIQESALPHTFKFPRDDFEIYATMDPAKEVGGDFYDFFFIDTDKICLVIADVSGKGIPAALFMMRSKTALRSFAEQGMRPGEIFTKANETLCEGNDTDMFVTVWMGILDLCSGHMICANAGHEYPALMRNGGEYELYKQKHSVALGAMEGAPFKEYELDLNPGDSLFVYTDGIPEAINEESVQYGTDRLLKLMNANKDSSEEELLKFVRQDVWTFSGTADQFDDVTMLGFKYIGKN